MITIKEVADLAGVSKATVSRVLNNSGYVSAQTRKKITEIMEAYHYIPSAAAVTLSRQESRTIGIVVPEIGNSFYADIVHGISQLADEMDLSLVLFDTQNSIKKEEKVLQLLQRQRVKGIILGPSTDYQETQEGKQLFHQLLEMHLPIVIVDRDFPKMPWDAVLYENYESSFQAAMELKNAGNKTAGVLAGNLHLKIARDRLEGFQDGARACGLTVRKEHILPGNFTMEEAYKVSKKFLETEKLPDAIYSCNNQMTLGFLRAAREAKIETGKDIAFIGNDRIEYADIFGVPLSYICRDNYEMGRKAMQLLEKRMQFPKNGQEILRIPYTVSLKGSEKKQ